MSGIVRLVPRRAPPWAGGRRQGTGGRGQEAVGRRQEAGGRRQGTSGIDKRHKLY